jgi:hypothetical protein
MYLCNINTFVSPDDGHSHPKLVRYRSSCNRPRWPKGFCEVKAPDFLDVQHYKGGKSSAIRTDCLYPRRNPWYSLSEAESTSGHMVPSVGAMEKIP